MKPTISKPRPGGTLRPPAKTATFAPPSPKVSRQSRAKVLTAVERNAFLASRPDLKTAD